MQRHAFYQRSAAPSPVDFGRIVRADGATERNDSTFAFPMVLATGGEASDGHVLSIKGGTIAERLPLLVSHWNDPEAQVGSITSARKQLDATPPELHARGVIELDGEGAQQERRADLAHMIEAGHVGAVSIRWVGDKVTARRDLPVDHPAHVDQDEKNLARRYGLFFETWRALEGSVVAVGADPDAVIARGHGEEATWRAFLSSSEEPEPSAPLIRVANLLGLACEAGRVLHVPWEDLRAQLAPLLPDLFESAATPAPESEPRIDPAPPAPVPAVADFGIPELRELLEENQAALRRGAGEVIARALGKVPR
jgi:hypothetical protein